MGVVIDPQAIGWHDDGTESGALRVLSARGNYLVKSFRKGGFGTSTTGTASPSLNLSDADPGNEFGGLNPLVVTVPSGINQGATVNVVFYGTVFGLSWQKNYASPNCGDFSVLIDGVAYYIQNSDLDPQSLAVVTSPTWNNLECLELIATDLPDGKHYAQIQFNGPASGATWAWLLHGYIVEQRAGYQATPPVDERTTTGTVPTAALTQPSAVAAQDGSIPLRSIKKVFYYNPGASSATITVSDTSAASGIFQSITLAAGASAMLDLGNLGSGATYYHQSTLAGVQFKMTGQVL